MLPLDSKVFLHEASHVVVANKLGIKIVRICVDPEDAHVRTRFQSGKTTAEKIAVLKVWREQSLNLMSTAARISARPQNIVSRLSGSAIMVSRTAQNSPPYSALKPQVY